jgi:hypothetical protein
MHKNQAHEWHENRPKDEGGGKRYTRAKWDTRYRQWQFSLLEPEFDEWQRMENPGLAQYEELRDVLFRKYQRKRLALRFVEDVDAILERMRAELGSTAGAEPPEGEIEEW